MDTVVWYLKHLIPDFWGPARWVPKWYSEECQGRYEGRENWWATAGFKDPVLEQGKWTLVYGVCKENHFWYDSPPVESRFGTAGKDQHKYTGDVLKWDTPIPTKEFAKYMYENNPTVKDIYAKWDISKEHPGLSYMPNLLNSNHRIQEGKEAGRMLSISRWFKVMELDILHSGPKFWDAPWGDHCFSKVFAICKWAAVWMIPWTIYDVWGVSTNVRGFRRVSVHYLKNCYMPLSMLAVYTATGCLACSQRKVDDYKNHVIGGIAAGTMYGTQHGFMQGFGIGFWAVLISIFLHLRRTSEYGFSGMNIAKQTVDSPIIWRKGMVKEPEKPTYKF